jgi:peptide/nickel transport system permease protein
MTALDLTTVATPASDGVTERGAGRDAPAPAGGAGPGSLGAPEPAPTRRLGRPRRPLLRTVLRPRVLLPGAVVLLVLAWGVAPTLFASADPITGVPADKLLGPSPAHWFGTDHIGRDLFSRTVHGTSLSLQAALIAIALSLSVGAVVGLVSGFVGGWLDDLLMRGVDVLLAVPGLLLSLAIVTALGFGTVKVAIAVGVAGIATFARVMRVQVLRVRHATFVQAAMLAGASRRSIVARHVLPNSVGPVLVLAAVEFGAVILSVSALSFLGYGATPPTPEWGSLVSEGRNYLAVAWWYSTLPGFVIVVFVVAVNRLGSAFRRQEGQLS